MKNFKFWVLSISLIFSSVVSAQNSPIPMLEKTANSIIQNLEQNKSRLKSNPTLIYSSVRKYLLPVVDVRGMSRSVLGRNAWRKANATQRKQFSKEFTKLVIRTYASPLAEYTDEKIKFYPLHRSSNKRFIQVKSEIIRSQGPNIPINYSLVAKKGGWKIYDITVEGVSLLQSFRSQFTQSLQGSNIQALIGQLRTHNRKEA